MHLMYYLDENGKRVYTLKVRLAMEWWCWWRGARRPGRKLHALTMWTGLMRDNVQSRMARWLSAYHCTITTSANTS
jgi:hypothetical protein